MPVPQVPQLRNIPACEMSPLTRREDNLIVSSNDRDCDCHGVLLGLDSDRWVTVKLLDAQERPVVH